MKKIYIQPNTEISEMWKEEILATSTDIISDGIDGDIIYGGVDEGGTLDPAARESLF